MLPHMWSEDFKVWRCCCNSNRTSVADGRRTGFFWGTIKSESDGDARVWHLDASADKISEFGALLEFKNNFSAKLADELQK